MFEPLHACHFYLLCLFLFLYISAIQRRRSPYSADIRGYPRIYQKQKNQNNERNNDYLYREKLNLFVGTEFNVKTVLEVISWKEFVIPDKSLNVYVGTGDPLNVVLV